MKLLTLNVDDDYFHGCVEHQTDGRGKEVLFIDWIPTTGTVTQNITHQIQIIESTPDDVKLVVFDRHSAMSDSEVSYFEKRGAVLLEPMLMPRPGFVFMPYYITQLDLPLSIWDNERPFHFGYKGESLSTQSESIILGALKDIKDIQIGISNEQRLDATRYDALKDVVLFGDFEWGDFQSTVLTGIGMDYHRGVLPDITNHLKYGVLPLVSHEHKWFHSLFKEFLIFDSKDVQWCVTMYSKINYGMIEELYKNIKTYMPEMMTERFVHTIVQLGNS